MAEAHYLVLLSTGSPSFRRQKSWVGIRTQRQPVVKIDHSTSQSLVLSDSGYCGQAPLSVSVFIKVNTGTQVPKYLSKVLRSSLNVTDYNWAWYLLGYLLAPVLTQVSNSFLNGFFFFCGECLVGCSSSSECCSNECCLLTVIEKSQQWKLTSMRSDWNGNLNFFSLLHFFKSSFFLVRKFFVQIWNKILNFGAENLKTVIKNLEAGQNGSQSNF